MAPLRQFSPDLLRAAVLAAGGRMKVCRAFAAQFGSRLSNTTLGYWLVRGGNPRLDQLLKLCFVLGVEVEDLLAPLSSQAVAVQGVSP